MTEIVVGEKVVNKNKETGTIVAFDGRFLKVDFQSRVSMFQADAFEKGFLSYESAALQSELNHAKLEKERQAEQVRMAVEEAAAVRRQVQGELSRSHFNVAVLAATSRLDPAPITQTSIRKKDQDLVRAIFAECDKDIKELYNTVKPDMAYLRYGSNNRSKYCVGFLCKYLDTYVFRVFSRNDDYSKNAESAVTIQLSDTTEVLRVLRINEKVYYFSKNLAAGGGYLINTKAHKNWHVSDLDNKLLLNKVIQNCDCGYLNNYIATENVDCLQYTKLMVSALHNNKAEIVFKHKLFAAAHRIENLETYLKEFTPKQITVACQNRVLNTLPVMKRYGNLDPRILGYLEILLRKRKDGSCTYNMLKKHILRLGFDCPDVEKKLISFLKKVVYFDPVSYEDYINMLVDEPGVTLQDFFDRDYLDRHMAMVEERMLYVSLNDKAAYDQTAEELSWIDREENDYFIIVPKTIAELRAEGAAQHNCVYTNQYFRNVIARESIIVFLRKEKNTSFVTIEFNYETFEVYQAYGKRNMPIDPELYRYIVDLGKQLYYEMHTQQ